MLEIISGKGKHSISTGKYGDSFVFSPLYSSFELELKVLHTYFKQQNKDNEFLIQTKIDNTDKKCYGFDFKINNTLSKTLSFIDP
jgi:hypothetical protein